MTRVLRSCGGVLRTSAGDLAVVTMPSECRLCGGAMLTVGTVRVCGECLAQVGARSAARDEAVCTRCGDALGMESLRFAAAMGMTCCTMCRLAPPGFARAVAGGDYDDEMREMLHLLKFAGRRRVAESVLGERLAGAVALLRASAACDVVVVPVPLYSARERERGYNQALLLARAAVDRLKKGDPKWRLRLESDGLRRVKDTRSLYLLSPKQRRASLRGAFRVAHPERFAGREVLLIDDIMTTGATARECANVLLRAGAAKVWVATAAKAQPQGTRSERVEPSDVASWSPQSPVEPDPRRQRGFGQ